MKLLWNQRVLAAVLAMAAATARARRGRAAPDTRPAATGARSAADEEGPPELAVFREPVDRAVEKALAWLARTQVKEDKVHRNRILRHAGQFEARMSPSAVTALAGMAFLSKGYTPDHEPHGDVINGCIDYVLKCPDKNAYAGGRSQQSGGGMYAHCICTLFLSEVSGMAGPARQKKIDEILPKMLHIIIAAHQIEKDARSAGGWRYNPDSKDSDLSLTGWALMALRSGFLNGAPVGENEIKDTLKYILRCHDARTGGFRYQPNGRATDAMTGVGLLCLELMGKHRSDITRKAGDHVLRPIRTGGFVQGQWIYYTVYYCSQGMFQLGDDYWVPYARKMYKVLLKAQQPDGSWPDKLLPDETARRSSVGANMDAYRTAMAVLSLTVSYRQLPIYQRDEPLRRDTD